VNELPPPGWYPDVQAPGHERWWDGREWSSVTREASRVVPQDTGATNPYVPAPVAGLGPAPVPFARERFSTTPDGVPLASWSRRAAAWIIDFAILWAIVLPLAWDEWNAMWSQADRVAAEAEKTGSGVDAFAMARDPAFQENFVNLVLIALAVSALLQIVFVAMRGATPGMQVLGLRVRRLDGAQPPSWGRSFVRWLVGYFPLLALGIFGMLFWVLDVAFPLWDVRRQALHDKAARTLVVRGR
jgi:uncharacterized RDD family membrane protein YckC